MTVNNFKVGDGIILYGWRGTVIDIDKQMRENGPCTYLKVAFENPEAVGYQYEGGWFGGLDNVVAYGHYIK